MMPVFVHYHSPPTDDSLSILRSELVDDIKFSSSTNDDMPVVTQILIAGQPKLEHLTHAKKLEALIIPWAGIPTDTHDLLLEHQDVTVHNLHHNAEAVAELALALLLSAAKFIVPFDADLRDHNWQRRYLPNSSLLLSGKTALILGYGAIGRRVAIMCKALGMQILAIRRQPESSPDPVADEIHGPATLAALLPRTHALMICLPLTDETSGMIGETELALMPSRSVLVNIGRGRIVDEAALYHSLRDAQILAAGLDVWYNYPSIEEERSMTAPSTYPFHELENVVLSPHRGGATSETNLLRMHHLARMLNEYVAGEELPNRVDLEAGY
jgi:phosphoglycerate dehydrogenase-like enzyme